MIRVIYPGKNGRMRGQVMGMQELCLDIQKQWHGPNSSCQTFCYPYYTMVKRAEGRKKMNSEKENISASWHKVTVTEFHHCFPGRCDWSLEDNSSEFKTAALYPTGLWQPLHAAHLVILSWFGVTLACRQCHNADSGSGNAGVRLMWVPLHTVRC